MADSLSSYIAREHIIQTWRIDALNLLLAGWESIRPSDLATLQPVAPTECEGFTLLSLNPLVDCKILSHGEMHHGFPALRLADRAAAKAWLNANAEVSR